jgi:hypothetical protein
MSLHVHIFPCKISANDILILHSISNDFDCIIETLLLKNQIPERIKIIDIPNVKYLFNSLLSLKHPHGLNFNSFAIETIILKVSYLICILTNESESLNVLQNLKLLEIVDRLKHIFQTCYAQYLQI